MNNTERPIAKNCKNFSLFDYLKEKGGYQLETVVSEFTISKNEYLYRPPIELKFIYEVIDGAVKLGSYTEHGEEFVYDVVAPTDFFGNLKYLNNQFFEFSKTLTSTKLRAYKLTFFKKVVVGEPEIAEWFISYLVQRWCIAEKKLRKINEKSTLGKLHFLQSNFDKNIKDVEGNIYTIYDLLTQKDLGDLIGATRQTIATALKKKSVAIS